MELGIVKWNFDYTSPRIGGLYHSQRILFDLYFYSIFCFLFFWTFIREIFFLLIFSSNSSLCAKNDAIVVAGVLFDVFLFSIEWYVDSRQFWYFESSSQSPLPIQPVSKFESLLIYCNFSNKIVCLNSNFYERLLRPKKIIEVSELTDWIRFIKS